MSSSEDDGYSSAFSESDFQEPFRASAAPSHMLHDQRDPLHSDDDRQRGRSVAREQLVLSHWRELLYALAAKRRAAAPTRTTFLAPPSRACSYAAVAIKDDEPAAAIHDDEPAAAMREVSQEIMDEASGEEDECERGGFRRARLRAGVVHGCQDFAAESSYTVVMTGHDKCHVL